MATSRAVRALSLFSGIGAFELAAATTPRRGKAPIAVKAHAEIDPNADAVYRYHFPDIPNLGDVAALSAAEVCPIAVPTRAKEWGRGGYDLLVSGVPWHDLSVGILPGRALKGKRSGLFWDVVKMLERDAPRYFLFENVLPRERAEVDVISDALGVQPVMIDAATFTGQRRKRYFWCNWSIPALPKTSGPRLVDALDPVAEVDPDLKHTQTALDYRGRYGGKGHADRWHRGHHGDTKLDKAPTLPKNLQKGQPYNVLIDRRFDPPLVRRYSATEVERLFGYPEDWTRYGVYEGRNGQPVTREVAYTRRLAMLGNTISVPVMAHILKGLP